MFIQLKNAYFGKQPGERVDVEEPNPKTLIEQGVAEAAQGDHLSVLIEKQIGGMLEALLAASFLAPVYGLNRPRRGSVELKAVCADSSNLPQPVASGPKEFGRKDSAKQTGEFVRTFIGKSETQDAKVLVGRELPPKICDVDGHKGRLMRGSQ